MQLLPVTFPQGYGMVSSLQADVNSSWGGNIIASGGKFHMYVNAISNQCLLESWAENSRIDHVVSDTVEGPYKYLDTAINMTSSNPAPVVLSGDVYKYAIFHIFNGTTLKPGGEHCFPNGSRIPPVAADARYVFDNGQKINGDAALGAYWGDHQISVSNSLDGPWELLQPGNAFPKCNNPAPWVHPNGTLYCLCGEIWTAESIKGPWRNVSSVFTRESHADWPKAWHHEDPFLFTTKRGWHVLYHASIPDGSPGAGQNCTSSVVSAHMFSVDGLVWHPSSISPYGTQVEVQRSAADGGDATRVDILTVATRERPKLVFDTDGQMTHLINGVCGAPSCTDSTRTGCVDCKYKHWDFTLIQPIQQSTRD
jgi:hypothetical protein